MLFVAIFSKLAICILYGRDFDLITQKPNDTCYVSYESLLNSSQVSLIKLYPIVRIHDMLGTNEMKGSESLYEQENTKNK